MPGAAVAPVDPTIRVEGLADLQRAFSRLEGGIGKDIKAGLESAAEPVRSSAQQLALERISGLSRGSIPWYTMRTGVTRTEVYVAPARRGSTNTRLKRPKFGARLLAEAMQPALSLNLQKVEQEMLDTLDDAFRSWERV